MVRSQLNTAKSFRTVRAPHAKGTIVAIEAAVNLGRSSPVAVPDKRQSPPLRADEFVFRLVVPKAAHVKRYLVTLTAFRIVQLSRSFAIRNDAIGLAPGRFQDGIIGVIPAVGHQLIRRSPS